MSGNTISLRTALVCAGLIGLLSTGCSESDPVSPDEAALAGIRQATTNFQNLQSAQDAGYSVLVTHPTTGEECLWHENEGGMGVHYLNPDLFDGEVDGDAPEVMIYANDASGKLRLVAVEYVIPFTIRSDEEPPPVLFGQEFKRNYTFNLWALHAWAWKDNPSGAFADYNPEVSCK
jgi:hypothetical protein